MLAPWPNRLGDGHYSFEGPTPRLLSTSCPANNAIHGLVRWLPWRMAGRAQNRVTMACVLSAVAGLSVRPGPDRRVPVGAGRAHRGHRRREPRTDRLPFGLGFHPYLTVGTPTVDQVRLTVPAERRLVTDDRGLPTGPRPVAGTEFDFTGAGSSASPGWTPPSPRCTGTRTAGPGWHSTIPTGTGGVTLWADERVRLRDGLHRGHPGTGAPPDGGGGGADDLPTRRLPVRHRRRR